MIATPRKAPTPYIYLIAPIGQPSLVKVGVSIDYAKRLAAIESHVGPCRLIYIELTASALLIEAAAKRHFADRRAFSTSGEWLRVSPGEVVRFLQMTACRIAPDVGDHTAVDTTPSDTLGLFVTERVRIVAGGTVQARAMYAAYQAWARSRGLVPMFETKFGMTLKGIIPRRDGRVRLYLDCMLRDPDTCEDREDLRGDTAMGPEPRGPTITTR